MARIPRSGQALSLAEIAGRPDRVAYAFPAVPRGRATLRPFQLGDEDVLIDFFDGLSEETREWYGVTEPGEFIAQEWSQAIAVYDKLRLVLHRVPGGGKVAFGVPLAGVVEFSLDLTDGDRERFGRWGQASRRQRSVATKAGSPKTMNETSLWSCAETPGRVRARARPAALRTRVRRLGAKRKDLT